MNTAPLLEITNLNKTYLNGGTGSNEVITGLSLAVRLGDFVCILGPSGCGKSTLLRCISGMEAFDGSILLNGRPTGPPGPDRIMVFQEFNQLFPWKTILQNVQYPLALQGKLSKPERLEMAGEYLEKVGLWESRDYYPHQLSGGMKQRAAIARALVLKPPLMLMDEPFASLDAITRNRLQKELLAIVNAEGSTILFVTHNIQEAMVLGSRLLLLTFGGVIAMDVPNTLEKPVKPTTPGYAQLWDRFNQALKSL